MGDTNKIRCWSMTSHFFLLFLMAMMASLSQSMPYMLLTSTRSKCMSVIVPQGQVIFIEYNAPDLKLPKEGDEEEEKQQIKLEEEKPEAAADGEQGLDSQWNKRMKERLEKMKSKKPKDISITVTQKSGFTGGALASRQRKMTESTVGQGRVREELVQRNGIIKFLTGEEDGTVEICVQSIVASVNNPSRFWLKVSTDAVEDEESKPNSLDVDDVKSKMSHLERELQTLQSRVKACLNNADYNKDQEAAFHQQSISMNKATTYWPIIHLIVIVLTGFTQANHIVHYFKSHHIGV